MKGSASFARVVTTNLHLPMMLCNITANQNDFNTYTAMLQSCITSLFQHVKQKEKLNVNIKCDNLTFMKIIESSLTESLTSSALSLIYADDEHTCTGKSRN